MYITEQRTDNDCFLTALSMFLNKPYEDLCSLQTIIAGDIRKTGIYENECIPLAKGFGARLKKKNGRPKRKAILITRNDDYDGLHAVYYDGVRAIDPSRHTYHTTEELLNQTLYHFY